MGNSRGASQYIGGIFRAKPIYYVGGASATGPRDRNVYAGNVEGAEVNFEVNPSIQSRRRGPIRRLILGKVRQDASVSTQDIAYQLDENFRKTFAQEIAKSGGYDSFVSKMNMFNAIENKGINVKETFSSYFPNDEYDRISAVNYLWKNPDKYDETMQAISNAGSARYGVGFKLTGTDGAYLGSTKVEGVDTKILGLFVDGYFESKQPNQPTLTLIQAATRGDGSQYPAPGSIATFFNNAENIRANTNIQIATTKTKQRVCRSYACGFRGKRTCTQCWWVYQ